jgi:hypothetical protein
MAASQNRILPTQHSRPPASEKCFGVWTKKAKAVPDHGGYRTYAVIIAGQLLRLKYYAQGKNHVFSFECDSRDRVSLDASSETLGVSEPSERLYTDVRSGQCVRQDCLSQCPIYRINVTNLVPYFLASKEIKNKIGARRGPSFLIYLIDISE